MTGINKQQASVLYGNNYKLQDKEGKTWEISDLISNTRMILRMSNKFIHINYNEIGVEYLILARNLEQLTQTIMHNGDDFNPSSRLWKRSINHYLEQGKNCNTKMWSSEDVNKLLEYNFAIIEGIPSEYYVNLKNE